MQSPWPIKTGQSYWIRSKPKQKFLYKQEEKNHKDKNQCGFFITRSKNTIH